MATLWERKRMNQCIINHEKVQNATTKRGEKNGYVQYYNWREAEDVKNL